jgi:hypothetical protein
LNSTRSKYFTKVVLWLSKLQTLRACKSRFQISGHHKICWLILEAGVVGDGVECYCRGSHAGRISDELAGSHTLIVCQQLYSRLDTQSVRSADRQARKEVREKEGGRAGGEGGEGERGAGAEGGTEGLWPREYITELPPELAAAGTSCRRN